LHPPVEKDGKVTGGSRLLWDPKESAGMSICKVCGFVTYVNAVMQETEMTQHYRINYRKAPNVTGLYTGERKLHYHAAFLGKYFPEWRKKETFAVAEIGAAYGLFLNWFRTRVPKAEVYGTELGLANRRVAYHEFGIQLDEEFDYTKKYDLISSYKVAEHQPNFDEKLKKYIDCLKDDGLMYISIPDWFSTMTGFGTTHFSLDYYYDVNHVNLWTRKLFEQILKKCGLEIIDSNHTYYDQTYLCKRCPPSKELEFENAEDILTKMKNIKEAYVLYSDGKFIEAQKAYPSFMDVYPAIHEKLRAESCREFFPVVGKDKNGADILDITEEGVKKMFARFIKPALDNCPDKSEVYCFAGQVLMKYDRYKEAIGLLAKAIEMKPDQPMILKCLADCYRMAAEKIKSDDPAEAIKLFKESRDIMNYVRSISEQYRGEATSWVYADSARLATPFESDETKHLIDL